ncbi:MAG: hypothetical protein OQK35_00170, partial [Alphaproteobacteria bacterium]|nr:hypothetical protein [Alphaproteobacteria bacterium]
SIPVYSWYLDHPYINSEFHEIELDNHILGMNCPLHIDFHKKSARVPNKRTALLPHPAKFESITPETNDRPISILFVGTGARNPEAERQAWNETYGTEVSENLERMLEVYKTDGHMGLQHIAEQALGDISLVPWGNLRSYCIVLDSYIRNTIKYNAAKLTFEAGGMVVGPNWGETLNQDGHKRLPGAYPIAQVKENISQAKAFINPVPVYYQSHERVPYAIEQGAVPIAPTSDWSDMVFGEAIVPFDFLTGTREEFGHMMSQIDDRRHLIPLVYKTLKTSLTYTNHAQTVLTELGFV